MDLLKNGKSVQEALNQSMKGASEAATRHAVAMNGAGNTLETFTKQQNAVRKGLQQTVDSFSAASLKGKALNTVIQGLSMAGNMAIFTAISIGIEKFVSWIDDAIHHSEKLQEAAAEARSSINDIQSSFQELASSTNSIKDRYAELAQGIDQLSGKNISLSSDDYHEFLDLSNQLSELFPSLTKNYDDNGNAILSLTGNIDGIVGSLDQLIEDQKSLANQKILENLPDAYAGYAENLKKYNSLLDAENAKAKSYQYYEENGFQLSSETDAIDASTFYKLDLGINANDNSIKEAASQIQETLENSDLTYSVDFTLNDDGIDEEGRHFIRINAVTDQATEQLNNFCLVAQKSFDDLKTDSLKAVKDTRLLIQQETAEFIPSINAMVSSIPQFTSNVSVSEEQQNIVKQMLAQDTSWIANMYEELGDKTDKEKMTDWMLKHVLSPITDNKDLQLQLSSLFNPDSELTPEQMVTLAASLKEQFEANRIPLTLDFILNPDIEGSAANLEQNLEQITNDALYQKYGFNKNTLASEVGLDKKREYLDDYEKIKEFSKNNSINTQDEIAALHDALEESEYDIDKALGSYLHRMMNSNKTFTFNSSSFADSMDAVSSLKNLYAEVSNAADNGMDFTFQTSEIEALRDAFGDTCTSFDEFELLATSASTSSKELQAALNQLLNEALVTQNTFDGLNSETRDSIVSQLELQNVSNASDIITERVAEIVGDAAEQQLSLADAADFVSNGLVTEADFADGTASKIYSLATAEIAYNNTQLDTQGKIDALGKLANAYGDTTSSLLAFNAAEAAEKYAKTMLRYSPGDYDVFYEEGLEKELQHLLETMSNTPFSFDGNGNRNPSSDKTSSTKRSSSKSESTPQTYDWIEHKLSSLKDKTDSLNKAFENAFTINSTKEKFREYLSGIETELEANRTASTVYQDKLNSIGLSQEWIDKIQNGSYSIEEISNETLKSQISEYESYYNKKQECEKNLISLTEQKVQAQKSYADKMISYYDKEISKVERLISLRESLVSLKETFGGSASVKDMKYQQNRTAIELSKLLKQNLDLKELQKTVEKGGDAWDAYQTQIDNNNEKVINLTQSIADLAVKLANLPMDKLEQFLEKNDAKNELYEARLANRVKTSKKNKLIDKQIQLVEQNNAKTQKTAEQTSKNLKNSKSALKSAWTADKKGLSTSDKKQAETYYKKLQSYTKKGKKIPADLITKLSNAGLEHLVTAATNYNAAVVANETAKETAKLTAETSKKDTAELSLEKFNNIQQSYDRKQSQISQQADNVSAAMDLSEARGHLATQSYYNQLIAYEKKNKKSLENERKKLQTQLDNAVKSGEIKKYSDEWWEMTDAIHSVDQSLAQSTLSLREFKNQMQQVEFDNFDYLQEQISRLASEADFYLDLMSDKPLTSDGGLTDYGTATIGLHAQNYETYTSQAKQYADEITRINAMLAKAPANTTLLAQLQSYQDMQQECIRNAENEKKAIADLVREGYEALIDSLSESISKYKELLQNAKDAHDYQKNISEQSENISTLRKQISAYSSMTGNEEVAAKLQRLKDELEDAQSNLQETLYDKYISDTQDALDDMLDGLEDFINDLSQDIDKMFQEGVSLITNDSGAIRKTLTDLSNNYGTTLSDAMKTTWGNYLNAAGGINAIITAVNNMAEAADRQNDNEAYKKAEDSYTDYRKYEEKSEEAAIRLQTAKKERDNAKAKRDLAKKELDNAEKKYGKDSIEYEHAYDFWQNAEKQYNDAKKAYKKEKDNFSDIQDKLDTAKAEDKTVLSDFLNSIVNTTPTNPDDEMDILEKYVNKITGGYLSDYNRNQLFQLLNVDTTKDALFTLEELGLITLSKKDTDLLNKYQFASDFNPNDFSVVTYTRAASGIPSTETSSRAALWDPSPNLTEEYARISRPDFSLLTSDKAAANENVSVTVGDVYLPNVTNPKEFASELVDVLKNDTTVQKTFGTFVNTSLIGGNSLSARKYQSNRQPVRR